MKVRHRRSLENVFVFLGLSLVLIYVVTCFLR